MYVSEFQLLVVGINIHTIVDYLDSLEGFDFGCQCFLYLFVFVTLLVR